MPFFQMEKIKNMIKIFSFLLVVFIVVGCVAQKTENAQTAEQAQMQQGISDKSAVVPGDRQISAVSVELQDQIIEIRIQGNQKLVYTSIKQSFPFGIAIYLPETVIADSFKTTLPENESIGDLIVTYADEEKTTVKVEILLKEDLNYEVTENNNTLKLVLSGGMEKDESLVSEENIIIPDKTATMTHIEFNTMEDGKSDIVVQTNHPVKYDITQAGNDKLYLNLYNTIIPDYHRRPFLTQYFKSAVESLMPIQVPGEKKNSKIEIKIREQVPYRIVRNQNIISIFFEPSMVEPPVFTKATKKVISGSQTQTVEAVKEGTDLSEEPEVSVAEKQTMEELIFGPKKKYTGEKIKLDFYETDIKNVFRILRSVGKRNFAIDNNVEGKVTLTLENPVPWDQVLDLVLKMNNLGMEKEGDVTRIATLDTLTKEENILQEVTAARKKSLEQKKSLEPLDTKYLSINYSDAETEIKPHIDQILTKDRGNVTVDKRTNTIVITDTQPKIDQAKKIIDELDQVIPQIMIEARIVEVTKEFSRELGIGLSLSDSSTSGSTVRSMDFTMALDESVGAALNTGSVNFSRIVGADLLNLKAKIAASETKGDVKVVSSPSILIMDNEEANITQGVQWPYTLLDDKGNTVVNFLDIDLQLKVTPHVSPDKRILMDIFVTKKEIDTITGGIPSLLNTSAMTKLLVNNNDTIVIAGIIKTTERKEKYGTPLLSDIPVLGRLFRTDTNFDRRNELLIFITPSIVQLDQKKNAFTIAD
ncbi:type IV pilus secretin PilQ [Desulfobacula sp.]|uniref:type IV pilus secretin PilQ n=1 Tax=Desulfobacula sp. TaxID=2593537 RepID=UPI0025BA861F|nr:type IV pilus secretin PilQ [Desulfobacula sp.]MBC2705226.1 type IV pilus secretin PilQ [Desulfobacula sp.]